MRGLRDLGLCLKFKDLGLQGFGFKFYRKGGGAAQRSFTGLGFRLWSLAFTLEGFSFWRSRGFEEVPGVVCVRVCFCVGPPGGSGGVELGLESSVVLGFGV